MIINTRSYQNEDMILIILTILRDTIQMAIFLLHDKEGETIQMAIFLLRDKDGDTIRVIYLRQDGNTAKIILTEGGIKMMTCLLHETRLMVPQGTLIADLLATLIILAVDPLRFQKLLKAQKIPYLAPR